MTQSNCPSCTGSGWTSAAKEMGMEDMPAYLTPIDVFHCRMYNGTGKIGLSDETLQKMNESLKDIDISSLTKPREVCMHYKNGREAHNGDKIFVTPSYGNPFIGILYDAVAGNDYCNGKVAIMHPSDPTANLQECLHIENAIPKTLVPSVA